MTKDNKKGIIVQISLPNECAVCKEEFEQNPENTDKVLMIDTKQRVGLHFGCMVTALAHLEKVTDAIDEGIEEGLGGEDADVFRQAMLSTERGEC